MECSRPEYWGGLPFPSPGDLPNPGMEPGSPALQEDSLPAEHILVYITCSIRSYVSCAVLCLVAQSCLTLCDLMDCSPPGSSVHGDSTGKNTGVGCHALLQGIFPTSGSNPGLPQCIYAIKLYIISFSH